ncbi:MAG: M20/M25/M40 family metallo-hydrolase [Cryobacterium sp.]|nr:M20/M25/M40 family metallo-hydrolase [Oligoflexia bacterium]
MNFTPVLRKKRAGSAVRDDESLKPAYPTKTFEFSWNDSSDERLFIVIHSTISRSLLVASVSLTGVAALPARAEPEATRLIEVRPGLTYWSNATQRKELSENAHLEGRCGGFLDLTDYPVEGPTPPAPSISLAGREPTAQAKVLPLIAQADTGNLLAIITKLSAYEDRNYQTANGVASANWIKGEYERIAKGRADIHTAFFPHRFKQPSVIATIDGTGEQKNEIVVIGGHIDSISPGKAPGADDNASGTATVLETFRILAESGLRPNRTIQFMGYAGEEEGLLGSQDVATAYRKEKRIVAGALQFDMTMFPGATPKITFITDYTNRDLTKYVQRLSDEYVKAPWAEDRCGYACSDHASWNKSGYASVFPFESAFNSYNPDIHTPRDTMDKIDAGHGLHYLKLALAFAVELAEAGPVVTEANPHSSRGSLWPGLGKRTIPILDAATQRP